VRVHDQTAQTIFAVLCGGAGANQAFASIGDLGLDLHQIERRRLADANTDLVLLGELLRQIERALLQRDVGPQRLQRPIRLLDRRHRLDDRFAKAEFGAFLAPLRDDDLLTCGIDLPIAQQRLGERELNARLDARIEAVQRAVARRSSGIPRDAPGSRSPRHALADTGRRKPIARIDAARAEQEIRRRRDGARSAQRRREYRRVGALARADLRGLDLGAEPDDREFRVVVDRPPNSVLEREGQSGRRTWCQSRDRSRCRTRC